MIEALTLIIGLGLGFVAGFLTDYYRNRKYFKYKWNNWDISSWEGMMSNKFYMWARNNEHDASIVLGPDGTLDIDYRRAKL